MRSIRRTTILSASFSSGAAVSPGAGPASQNPPIAPADETMVRLLKYIPAEIIVIHTTTNNIVKSCQHGASNWLWLPFGLGVLSCIIYFWRMQQREISQGLKRDSICWADIFISTAAFVLWAFTIGGPFVLLKNYNDWGPLTAAIVLPFFTFAAPFLKR